MPAEKTRILLVEDNPGDAHLMQVTLQEAESAKFTMEHVSLLADAIAAIEQGDVDVVLLDLSLPDSHGLESVETVHEMAPDLPIVVLTGLDDESIALKALQVGAQDYLVKGHVDSHLLVRSLYHSIERQRILDELHRVTNKMEKLALLDPLTELLNRRGLERVMSAQSLEEAEDGFSNFVILVDLDDFKRINDTMGHAVGDVVLKEVGKRLKKCLRPTDYVARIGGDEFMVILVTTKSKDALRVAERVRLSVTGTSIIESGQESVKVTASLGVAESRPETLTNIDELLSKTHLAIKESKRWGKNRVSYVNQDDSSADIGSDNLGQIIDALKTGTGFRVVHQPIRTLADESIYGYEMLSRGPEGQFEQPKDFFNLSMENNFLLLVDRRCLKNCIETTKELKDGQQFHINLFPSTILDVPPESLAKMFPIEPGGPIYCLEISEEQIIGDPTYLVEPVRRLREAGIHIAIDDLGFGRSCLESLILLEPEIVKIDRRCILGISEDKDHLEALKRLLKVTNALDSIVIAEGIETRGDLEVLIDLGVKYGQGFLWDKF